jgi:hypothetical protein
MVCKTSIFKKTRAKWTIAQAVDLLLCKCKALSSNPTSTGKKKKEQIFKKIK